MGFRLGDGLRSSASEAIDGRSEYQVPHNAATDISRCHAKREEQTTETDEQTQRIAKQDEKARRRHTEKRRITQSKADQKDKAIQQQTENIHTHNQSRKPKTIPTRKKPRASCTLLRGWRLKTAEYRRFGGLIRRMSGFWVDIVRLKPIIGDISAVVVWSRHRKTAKNKVIGA